MVAMAGLIALAAVTTSDASPPLTTPQGVPIEDSERYVADGHPTRETLAQIDEMIRAARGHGYQCDSVTALWPPFRQYGMILQCDHGLYNYEFKTTSGGLAFVTPCQEKSCPR